MGLSCNPPTPPDMRVRIRRFGTLRFPKQADLSAVAFSSPAVPFPHFAVLSGFTLSSSESSTGLRGRLWNTTEIWCVPSPFRSVLRARGGPRAPRLCATTTSADFSRRRYDLLPMTSPFQA